ncbi:hypothetical protein BDZ94DRAFT_1233755 [Collybia nuda]|uniref:Uncharacterized protein n=1 Tax=Collybia nuda TaxID=64659 RepID=A0A9P5YAT3_9AGAR|nr:hypothetical protein BDZ94DRAFT_1233755 [Collybia nuda]
MTNGVDGALQIEIQEILIGKFQRWVAHELLIGWSSVKHAMCNSGRQSFIYQVISCQLLVTVYGIPIAISTINYTAVHHMSSLKYENGVLFLITTNIATPKF